MPPPDGPSISDDGAPPLEFAATDPSDGKPRLVTFDGAVLEVFGLQEADPKRLPASWITAVTARGGFARGLSVKLRNGKSWEIPIAKDRVEIARAFAADVTAALRG